MTKSNPNKALETFIDTNNLRIRVKKWVKKSIWIKLHLLHKRKIASVETILVYTAMGGKGIMWID
jgi:hypothetical protein